MTEIHGRYRHCKQAMIKTWLSGYCSILIGINMGMLPNVASKVVLDTETSGANNVHASDVSFFLVKFSECWGHPVCQDVEVISSATSRLKNVWYIATRKSIFQVEFGTNGTSCNCTKIFKGSNSRAGCYLPQVALPVGDPTKIFPNGASFNFSDVIRWKEDWLSSRLCQNILNPIVKFGFFFAKLRYQNITKSPNRNGERFTYQSITFTSSFCRVTLNNLEANSVYQIHTIATMESGKQKSLMISTAKKITTPCKEPRSPKRYKCVSINDTALLLSWNDANNTNQVVYEVLWSKDGSSRMESLGNTSEHGIYLHGGLEYHNYTYAIKTYPLSCKLEPKPYSQIHIFNCKPFREPASLISIRSSNQSLSVLWELPEDNSVQNVLVEWMEISGVRSSYWYSSNLLKISGSFTYTITDLKCNTGYKIRTSQQYVGYIGVDDWISSSPIVRKTNPGTPNFPHNITVISPGILYWNKPNANGSPLLGYIVWCRNESSRASFLSHGSWQKFVTLYNWQIVSWELHDLPSDLWYQFRVSAINKIGEGDRSSSSNIYFYQTVNSTEDSYQVIGIIAGVVAFVVSLFVVILVWFCCTRRSDTSSNDIPSTLTSVHENVIHNERQHFHEPTVPQTCDSSKSSNMEPLSNLPLLSSENLELLEFLGKGAFGEVYEGIAYEVGEEPGVSTRVAVKVLREHSAGKKEFLMEARIMSNFHHKNIISLLGVCWEDKHQYLVMELMEGGDLSHYLREAKPTSITLAKLSSVDLIDICLDIAAGCKYLEEQHFIHRDLAARNCLVSTKDYSAPDKVVKIGDFGLARDIYRSEYYHKHGDGLLPVRWMAPESLEQNVYTTQSDVWSFGILLWEVMSYGRRPYQMLNDIEILQFIKTGGRLEKPDHCPDPIYLLMTKCWLSSPIFRPSFAWVLEFLHNIKDTCSGYCDSDSDVLPGAYATASISDEDFADEGIRTPRSLSIDSRGHFNLAFEGNNGEDTHSVYSLSIQEVEVEVHHSEDYSDINEPTQGKDPSSSLEEAQEDNTAMHENIQTNSTLPAPSRLLPYIGDLPITDEERLLRKKQWNQQVV